MDAASHWRLTKILLAIATAIVCGDALWISFGSFDIDSGTYAALIAPVVVLVGGAIFYGTRRNELCVAAAFAASAFLIVFPVACSLLSYLLLTISGPRIDTLLANIDLRIGFSWPTLMAIASRHIVVTYFLRLAYLSVMLQTAVLILLLGWKKKAGDLYALCLCLSIAAIITVSVWAMFPSFGAFSVFNLSPEVAARLGLALDGNYGHDLIAMLQNGPGRISMRDMRGLVGFPSYHTVQALALMWYARNISYVRWVSVVLNGIVLISIPIHGGHHFVDMLGGAAVTVAAIAIADRIVIRAARSSNPQRIIASPWADRTGSAPA